MDYILWVMVCVTFSSDILSTIRVFQVDGMRRSSTPPTLIGDSYPSIDGLLISKHRLSTDSIHR